MTDAGGGPAPSASNNTSSANVLTGPGIRCISYTFPDGEIAYEFVATVKRPTQPKKLVCTTDDTYLVIIEDKKGKDILAIYDPMTGEHMYNIKLNYPAYKDISLMVPIPKQPFLIGLIDSEKGVVMNVRDRKVRNDYRSMTSFVFSFFQQGSFHITEMGWSNIYGWKIRSIRSCSWWFRNL